MARARATATATATARARATATARAAGWLSGLIHFGHNLLRRRYWFFRSGGCPMDFEVDQGIAVLERTPAALHALLGGLPEEWTSPNEGPETFSAFDNVGHLIHGERTDWIARATIILEQGARRRFEPYDRFAQVRESQGKSLEELLAEFATLRAANIATLRSWHITDAQLLLTGEHPSFGVVTLRQLLATWVVHDLGHIAQIARVMAKQYRHEIGPWVEYLPIVSR